MMESSGIPNDLLLDYVLGQCEEPDAQRVRQVIAADAELAARVERIRARLSPLDTWTAPDAPPTMVSDILDRIAAHDAGLVVHTTPPAPVAREAAGSAGGGRSLVSLREILALAACIAILVGLFVPSMSAVKYNARRQMCASNLGAIGRASTAYAAENAGFLPYAGSSNGSWLRQPGKPQAPNTRHLILVLKGRYLPDMNTVICPGRPEDSPMDPAALAGASDFSSPRNRSYHLQYMGHPVRVGWVQQPFVMPYISDANPMFEGDTFNESVDPFDNSTSHRDRGQNVLFLDGSVRFHESPVVPASGDNMWQIRDLRHYSGDETPVDATDVFMAP